jgi:SAM-dependent methyltransferase
LHTIHPNVYSPLTLSKNIRKVDSLSVSKIVSNYKKEFDLDVSTYFKNISELEVFECQDTHLKFYYPFGLAGDGLFYDQLSVNGKSYYTQSKWEFNEAAKYIHPNAKVLEIACAEGFFLEQISKITKDSVGLELNPRAVKIGQEKGLNILPDLIQDHAKTHEETYDIVFAFQLFEHVENIREMFESSLKVLKKGGKLIIGVPNNSSPIFKLNKFHTLNVPPHHMLLWDEKSLSAAAKLYDLNLVSLLTQPTSPTLKSEVYRLNLVSKLGEGFLSKFIHTTTRWFVKKLPSSAVNQSILAVYEKKNNLIIYCSYI